MRRRRAGPWARCLVSLLLVAIAGTAVRATGLTLDLRSDPDPVARGERLIYETTIRNVGTTAVVGRTFHGPLPTGCDQWTAEMQVDGGGWAAYPVNGIVLLDPILAGATATVRIRTWVEHSASGHLDHAVELIGAHGVEASASTRTNVLPSVDAGADKMVAPGLLVELNDASAGDGGDGLASHVWNDDGAGGTFADPAAVRTTYTAPAGGGLAILSLTVVDRDGATADDSLRLLVNAPPSVDAGSDRAVDEGSSVDLDDAGATDPDGTIVVLRWDDADAGGAFTPSAFVLHPTYTAPTVAECAGAEIVLTLTAIDDGGATGSDRLGLTVHNVNAPPIVGAGPDRTVDGEAEVLLRGSVAEDGTVAGIRWEQLAGPAVALSTSDTLQPRFVAPRVGVSTELRFRLVVTDDCDASGSDEVRVDIVPRAASAALDVAVIADREAARVGDAVVCTVTVTNAGDVTLADVEIADDRAGVLFPDWPPLLPGESGTLTFQVPIGEIDAPGPVVWTTRVTARSLTGTGVADETTNRIDVLSDSSDEPPALSVTVEIRDALDRAISALRRPAPGDEIRFVVSVTNTGGVAVDRISARSARGGAVPLLRTALAPWERTGGSWDVRFDDLLRDGTDEVGVEVSGRAPDGTSVRATAAFPLPWSTDGGGVSIAMYVDPQEARVGETIAYTIEVANTGEVPVGEIALEMDGHGPVVPTRTTLGVGESTVAHATREVTWVDLPGPLTGTVRVGGVSERGEKVTAEATATIALIDEIHETEIGGGGALDGPARAAAARRSAGGRPRVIINEIAWAGSLADPSAEWIELRNLDTVAVDLNGWQLSWYPVGDAVPPEATWTTIDLSGRIGASPIDLTAERAGRPEIVFLEDDRDEAIWRVFDMSWWVAGKRGSDGRGYYVLERGGDRVVRDVAADRTYGTGGDPRFALPDGGAVLVLRDASGNTADTANAAAVPGWPGGDLRRGATMERSDPLRGDSPGNWHTNPGILVHGTGADGRRLAGTAGGPNSPSLDELTFLAEAGARATSGAVDFLLGRHDRRAVEVRVSFLRSAIGGGGAMPDLGILGQETDDGYRLGFDTSRLLPGTYFVWITGADIDAFLIPLRVDS